MDRLNILILHRLGNPQMVASFLRQHVFALKVNVPGHNYLYHDITLGIPNYICDIEFDAIILDVTLLCTRWLRPDAFERLKEAYKFVKYSNAVKIAFPQDEYDCNELLDEWMCDWAVDVVYSVLSNNWNVLYPGYSKIGEIRLGYTGYIEDSLINFQRKRFEDRSIDIGYRTKKLPPYFGKIGETKWTIGRLIEQHCKESNLNADIIMGQKGFLPGKAWYDFINDCKFTLGANSGSSLLDPRGHIQRKVKTYLAKHPNATFEEVEMQCFKGLDGHHTFTAISPRVLEAALLESCQILVEGDYSGIIKPGEHYIPIRDDASNFSEVLRLMKDKKHVHQIITNCRNTILNISDLRYRTFAVKLIEDIHGLISRKHVKSNCDVVRKVIEKYEIDMAWRYKLHWKKRALLTKINTEIDSYPGFARLLRTVYSFFC